MAEFPKHLLNTISEGDTIEHMSKLPDECVDLVVTSPPYGVAKFYEKDSEGKRAPFWRTIWLWLQCFRQFQRLLKPGGYVVWPFGDNTFGTYILGTEVHTTIPMAVLALQIGRKVDLELQATRIWRKRFASMGVPFICNIEPRPILDYEHIWTFRKRGASGKPTDKGLQKVNDHKISRKGVWDTTKEGMEELGEDAPQGNVLKGHGAAFPIAIPKWAITLYSDPGDVVIDNFMGTGTTAVAAEELGRNWYGIERDLEWVAYARERILTARAEIQRRTISGTQSKLEIA
jgi:DNA modification methylase